MSVTIELTHHRIAEKIELARVSVELIVPIINACKSATSTRPGRKYQDCINMLDNLHMNLVINDLDSVENEYGLAVVGILSEYYSCPEREEKCTSDYYRAVTSENFIAKISDNINRIRAAVDTVYTVLNHHIASKQETKEMEYELDDITRKLDIASNIDTHAKLERKPYEMCKCGTRMTIVPELSELHCENYACGKVKSIIGAIFRDDQFYPQDGQKTKHGGYVTSRHNKFWMERLQALETKTFSDELLSKIEYIMKRDGYNKRDLTCEIMRSILKDPMVNCTNLNDHAPLLVKIFGGPSPPQFDFQERRACSIRFNKAMKLYEIVNPDGGNKPYYPYFIYKIIESLFADNPEKLRLLDYIHLQSRETVIKNDKYYEQMCALADPQDGFVYTPTDPAGRL